MGILAPPSQGIACIFMWRRFPSEMTSQPESGVVFEHSLEYPNLPGNIQGTFREHAGNIQGTFREHSENIRGTSICLHICKCGLTLSPAPCGLIAALHRPRVSGSGGAFGQYQGADHPPRHTALYRGPPSESNPQYVE
jgi:hypothetical protein